MTDDLTTLLRDAGREPTIDLDVDAVHARGRRRTAVRRTAIGVGALALLGVVGVGIANLADTPDAPIVDQAPGDDGSEEAVDDGVVTAADLARAYGVTVHELGFDTEAFDGFDITVTTPAGVETARWTDDATQLADPVVADDGGIWALTPDGRTVRRDPATGEVGTVNSTGMDTGWLPIGRIADGRGAVLVTEVGLGDTTVAAPSTLYVATADGELPFQPFPAVDLADLREGERVLVATAAAEELVVLVGEDAGTRALLLRSGAGAVELLDVGGLDIELTDVALRGREAWVVGRADAGDAVLRRIDLDTREVVAVPVPAGVAAIDRVAALPDADVIVLGTRGDDETASALVLDVAVRDGAVTDVVLVLETATAALVDLLPWAGDDAGPLAACVDRPLNPPPGDDVAVWFLCWDAADQLAEGAAHPFVLADDRFSGADLAPDASGVRTVLEAWAAGPTRAEAAAGLTGGLDADVATVAGVTLDGTTATVDLAAGPQVGVLGTTTGRATTVQAIVGAVVQFAGVDAVTITLDGSCADWAALAETEGCPTYDESSAPWSQPRSIE